MIINSIQANLYPKIGQTKQPNKAEKCHNTNPLKCDIFTPSISFKADIHRYAQNGDLEGVKRELAKGVDVNARGSHNETPLIYACKYKHLEIVEELIMHPEIDVNIQNDYGNTALIWACHNGVKSIVAELLKHPDIDIDIKGEDRCTAKDRALKQGYTEIIEMIENYNGIDQRIGVKLPVNLEKLSPEENIWTQEEISKVFFKLVKEKKYDEAGKMLEVSPLIDLSGNDNKIIDEVCGTRNSNFVRKVFEYERKQPEMRTEYDARRKKFFENTIKTLGYEELHFNNVALNTIDGFKILMSNPEFNPNDTVEGASLFDQACVLDPEGNLAKQILDKYSDVYTADSAKTRNQTIKNLINEYESVGKYKMLLNKIKDNTTREETRKLAAQQLTDLIESGNFNPAMTDSNGNTVLHIAAALPEDSARMLIVKSMEKGVDINAENIVGGRPLMSAIMKLAITKDEEGRRSMLSNIRFLLDKGANVDAQDQIGQTALHFACSTTIPILLTMLLSKNPNVFILDKHGNRAAKYLKTQEMKDIYNKYLGAV